MNEDQLLRYSRHILLKDFDYDRQQQLLDAKVLIVGLGGLGCPVAMYLADVYTVQANLTGIPAVSLPLGIHTDGLPFGVQFFGNKFEEEKLLAFANAIVND